MVIVSVISNLLYLADRESAATSSELQMLTVDIEHKLCYVPFCDDFGPMNLAETFKFVEMMQETIEKFPQRKLLIATDWTPRSLTNSVYLLGAFLIMDRGQTPQEAWQPFEQLKGRLEMYRDATFLKPTFRLTVLDCLHGLWRAKSLGWTNAFDMMEYAHYDNPLEGDLHEVVPGKLIAFKGPCTLSHAGVYEDVQGCRHFAPQFYADIFADEMDVSTVIQLNEEPYDAHAFEARGIRCVNLEFPDCTSPPMHVILEFLHTVERAAGAVAVHCKAGLGRTGTLAALYMMKHHGFSARAAMGWLRIVRPGSVIGSQQEFLCRMQAVGEAEHSAYQTAAGEETLAAAAADAASAAGGSYTRDAARTCDCAVYSALGLSAGIVGDDEEEEGRAEAAARQLAGALESGGRTARRAAQARRASSCS